MVKYFVNFWVVNFIVNFWLFNFQFVVILNESNYIRPVQDF
jgi:hypothetical protein